ncbi:hypothetical protein [Cohnella soli]|uniref:Sigma-70 family RNA polymerase sigma factor n=1 Tax=Cohnella soli TaxID=425005 RepID=A0ABW0HQ14_9BACL
MGKANDWSDEEKEFLQQQWGRLDLPTLANRLGRPEGGIMNMVTRLSLGPAKDGEGKLTANQLAGALQVDQHTVIDYWIAKCGLKAEKRIVKKVKPMMMIALNDFWSWAQLNQDKLDTRRFAHETLGPEPVWMEEKREADSLRPESERRPWHAEDDEMLMRLKGTMTYKEIASLMGRTDNGVEKRIMRLRKNRNA